MLLVDCASYKLIIEITLNLLKSTCEKYFKQLATSNPDGQGGVL